jgi:hypothetical protein
MLARDDSSPHENQYLAAVSGMHEHTVSKRQEPAVGDFVSGRTAGKTWSGHVEWVAGGDMIINVGGGWWRVPIADITH